MMRRSRAQGWGQGRPRTGIPGFSQGSRDHQDFITWDPRAIQKRKLMFLGKHGLWFSSGSGRLRTEISGVGSGMAAGIILLQGYKKISWSAKQSMKFTGMRKYKFCVCFVFANERKHH